VRHCCGTAFGETIFLRAQVGGNKPVRGIDGSAQVRQPARRRSGIVLDLPRQAGDIVRADGTRRADDNVGDLAPSARRRRGKAGEIAIYPAGEEAQNLAGQRIIALGLAGKPGEIDGRD
jgi:hypothetical protein